MDGPVESLARALSFIHIWSDEDSDIVHVECNYCSTGDYVWAESENPPAETYIPAAMRHLQANHPGYLADTMKELAAGAT